MELRGKYMFKRLDGVVDYVLKNGIPGCDCIVYKDGKCVYRRMAGYSDLANKIPIKGKERFNVYSASKMITCVAALMLYEKGCFDLEDNLCDYMPEFETMYVRTESDVKKAENKIKIRDLFTMKAGFSYNLTSPMLMLCRKETDGKCPTRETMKYLAKEPLEFEPGTRWKYSLCHDVLAAFVEVVSDMRFGEFVKENIFKPLGMKNSTFLLDDSELHTVSTQYRFNTETKMAEPIANTIHFKLGTEYESGGAGCISTTKDFIKFLEALRKGELLKDEMIELMTRNYLTDEQRKEYIGHGNYGLGVRCGWDGYDTTTFGWGGAAGAYPVVDRKHNVTLFFVQHILGSDNLYRDSEISKFFTYDLD